MTTPEQLNQARVPQWFADRGPMPASSGFNDAVFLLLLPKLKLIMDSATLRLRNVTQNNRVPLGNVVAIIGDMIRDAYNGFVLQYEKQNEPMDPAATKAAIMLMIDDFYTKVVAPLDIPYVPNFIENTFVDPMVGKIVHEIASSVYDIVVKALDTIPSRLLPAGTHVVGSAPAPYAASHPASQAAAVTGKALAPNPMESADTASPISGTNDGEPADDTPKS